MDNRQFKSNQRGEITADRVKAANRKFYDAVAGRYEELDGRRSPALKVWLRSNLSSIRQKVPGGCLLDIGTGSGLVTRCAEGLFSFRVGVDISPKILSTHSDAFDAGVAVEVDRLPFASGSFDVITCFAVLHHLYDFEGLVTEVSRVLKPEGIFYSDHDMDIAFHRRFRIPLSVYRRFRNAGAKYERANAKITKEMYALAEWQENGVNTSNLVRLLKKTGFSVETMFHWYGLAHITDRLLGSRSFRSGWAPLLSVTAIKEGARVISAESQTALK